ncbi:hypothetical protein [Massilia sp. Leaf139]|uniref:hypothetical protein n=1 Tax=Massilia sp. Leaf139 TaxID=1736272 RepID=UPI0006FE4856|nr:hypothetical protein [Massilia sp. Leaf139]KQQ97188.1 hypothetical protein ASF77_04305 [Massilia sp. Leaf139]
MATIVIKDLPESSELDRQAMFAIAGGSRLRAGGAGRAAGAHAQAHGRRMRLFDLAPAARSSQAPTRPR